MAKRSLNWSVKYKELILKVIGIGCEVVSTCGGIKVMSGKHGNEQEKKKKSAHRKKYLALVVLTYTSNQNVLPASRGTCSPQDRIRGNPAPSVHPC